MKNYVHPAAVRMELARLITENKGRGTVGDAMRVAAKRDVPQAQSKKS